MFARDGRFIGGPFVLDLPVVAIGAMVDIHGLKYKVLDVDSDTLVLDLGD